MLTNLKILFAANIIIFCLISLFVSIALARDCKLLSQWQNLCDALENRVNQKHKKMKLTENEAEDFEHFLNVEKLSFPYIFELKNLMPKTSVELIMSVQSRDVNLMQSELIGKYLKDMIEKCEFRNLKDFDNNTSHIIGRKWHEIDYSGEGMTWQKQKAKYSPYGITDFTTIENIKRFFPVESKLPYFNKIYMPKKCEF